jgi:signal transduction histidine kinase
MADFYLLINIVMAIALAGLGITVLSKNARLLPYRVFAGFTIIAGLWMVSNSVGNDITADHDIAIVANRLIFFAGYVTAVLLLWFTVLLVDNAKWHKLLRNIAPVIVAMGCISATQLVAQDVYVQGGVYGVQFGTAVWAYFGVLLGVIVFTSCVFAWGAKHTRGKQRARLRTLLLSWSIALPLIIVCNMILPLLAGRFELTNVGIIPMLFLVYGVFYSVVRQGMFDLHVVSVRALAYVTTFTVLLTGYGVVSNFISDLLSRSATDFVSNAAGVVLVVLVATAYAPLKRFFDKITRRWFYRAGYESQELLEQIDDVVMRKTDISVLLEGTARTLQHYLHVAFVYFEVPGDKGTYRHIGVGANGLEVRQFAARARGGRDSALITDELESSQTGPYKSLDAMNISAIYALASVARSSADDLPLLILGGKKGGNVLTVQDKKNLRIITSELSLAIHNALQFEEIQQFNETLQAKVDTATTKLRQANERLKVLNETKDDFVSMASHQLRTPLTSIKGYLSMVLDGDMGKITAGQRQMIEQAFTSSQRMAYLISDLLNMSRLRTGRLTVMPGTVSLDKIIEQEIAQLRRMAQGNSVKLVVEEGETLPPVALDETKIRQVIMNLVDNAIYYTGRGGTVTVRLSQTPKSVELRVIDTGIGVPIADQHKLFTRFYRASNAKKVRPDGTGIGLYMVRKVVTALGGSVIFSSVEGKGSTFGFSFPKVAPKVLPTVTASDN